MEYLFENPWLIWTAVGVFFLAVELSTTALVAIWFVAAAVITAVASIFIDSVLWQVVIFLAFSAVFMVVFRRVYKKHFKKPDSTIKPENQLIGKSAVTTEATDAHGGKVLAGDVYWRAVSEDGAEIAKDETVIITGVNSTTLIIKKERPTI